LWLVQQQGLRHRRASGSARPPRTLRPPSAQLCPCAQHLVWWNARRLNRNTLIPQTLDLWTPPNHSPSFAKATEGVPSVAREREGGELECRNCSKSKMRSIACSRAT